MSDLHHINKARTRNRPARRWWRDNWKPVVGLVALFALMLFLSFMVHVASHDCAYTIDRIQDEECR